MSPPARPGTSAASWHLLRAEARAVPGRGCAATITVTDGDAVIEMSGEGPGVASAIAAAMGVRRGSVTDLRLATKGADIVVAVTVDTASGRRVGKGRGPNLVTATAAAVLAARNPRPSPTREPTPQTPSS